MSTLNLNFTDGTSQQHIMDTFDSLTIFRIKFRNRINDDLTIRKNVDNLCQEYNEFIRLLPNNIKNIPIIKIRIEENKRLLLAIAKKKREINSWDKNLVINGVKLSIIRDVTNK